MWRQPNAFGIAKPDQFPEGRKRLKWHISFSKGEHGPDDFQTKKLKGGIFEVKKYHKYRKPKKAAPILRKFEIEYAPEEGTDPSCVSNYVWRMQGNPALEKWATEEINSASVHIINTIKSAHSRYRKNPPYLKLVEPMTATGGR
ncbi:hypothetical protein SAMN05216404_11918 [Nitrosospira multiformis]|uniref:Uncharacterized protein n=1 Tax=Nitrosospira multiformis TaxID=1231 RepID=A0A1H8P5B2_9PROT|nr:hypothetical protein [Nitrosospira multiformis]SEO36991.1 hypothetical protein SAMN05216404_11918 [Nitrosospira multiformis]